MWSSYGRRARAGLLALMFGAGSWAWARGELAVAWALPGKAVSAEKKPGAAAFRVPPTPLAPAPPPAAASPAQGQLMRLHDMKAEFEAVRQRHAEASPERREAVAAELLDAGSRYRRQLIDAALASAGPEAPTGTAEETEALRALLRSELASQSQQLGRELREHTQNLLARSEELPNAKPEQAAQLSQRRDRSYQATLVVLEEMSDLVTTRSQLGDDVAASRAELQKALGDSARWTSGALASTSLELTRVEHEIKGKATSDEQTRLDALLDDQAQLAGSQRKLIGLMEAQGLDTVQLRRDLISTTRQLSHDILDAQVLSGLFDQWQSDARRWVSEHAATIAFRLVSGLFVLAVFAGLARLGRGLSRRAITRAKGNLSSLASTFLVATVGRLIWVIGFVIAAAQLGIEVAPLIAGLGIAGFVAGFALQDTLSNFASGLMILVYRPFDVGDMIEAGGATGAVRTMTLVYTSVLTPDNQMLIIPNNKIWGGVIRNVTNQAQRRIDLEFRVSYADDIDRAESLLSGVLRENPRVLADPAATVRLHELGDSSVKFVVRPWVKTGDYWDAYWEITREVKRRFDTEGFSVPFPQQDLHLHSDGAAQRSRRDSDIAPALAASG